MKNALIVIASVILAAASSQPLMLALQRVVLPRGQQFSVVSSSEPVVAFVLFTAGLCACAGFGTWAVCSLRQYALAVRFVVVVLPMIAGGCLATLLKAAQFERAVAAVGTIGLAPTFSLKQASLHVILVVSLVSGLFGLLFAFILRSKTIASK